MHFTCFHLMPYRPLDFAERAKHRSAWVVLPNSALRSGQGRRRIRVLYRPARLRRSSSASTRSRVNEHHQTAYGMMPAPNLIASALIQRTKTVKIAILGRALPLVNNPITIAEEFAMLDNLSRGRIITGFVRGIGTEYHATGPQPDLLARALSGSARPDRRRLDAAGAVRVRGPALQFPLRQSVAAALSAAASADLDSLAGLVGDDPLGGRSGAQISVPGHLQRRANW